MIEMLVAVWVSSTLGSIHCVGMCGPFVLLATRSATDQNTNAYAKHLAYHLGRLTTYLGIGVMMGIMAYAGNELGSSLGIRQVAAKLVGLTMILLGFARVWRLLKGSDSPVKHSRFFANWNAFLLAIRRRTPNYGPTANAFLWGLISTWLPCGWLYVFALAAAGAGGMLASISMMAAFWLGTLPWLTLVASGSGVLNRIHPKGFQWVAALILIAFGFWTWEARSAVDLSVLNPKTPPASGQTSLEDIHELTEQELPCCSVEPQ